MLNNVRDVTMIFNVRGLILVFIMVDLVWCQRLDSSQRPEPTFRKTSCRLLINEVNLFTENTRTHQFVELSRYCPDMYSYQRSISLDGTKLLFINPEGYLFGVCSLVGSMTPKTREVEITQGNKKIKVSKRYWLYLIGIGYSNINFLRDNCELTSYGIVSEKNTRFPIAIDFPYAIALIYNEKQVKSLNEIKLKNNGNAYEQTRITETMQKTIMMYLQDIYIYGSKTRFQYCKYFDNFYKFEVNKYTMLRDWKINSVKDQSISRCSKNDKEKQIEPIQPQLFLTTKPTPGEVNLCKTGLEFFIEDFQDNLETPYAVFLPGPDKGYECQSYTSTDGNKYGDISGPNTFAEQFNFMVEQQADESISESSESTTLDNTIDNDDDDLAVEPIVLDSFPENSYSTRTDSTANPIDQTVFERNLESSKPFIWNDNKCSRFSEITKSEIENLPGKPLDINDVLVSDTCNWFDYIPDLKLFRCGFCHKLLNQGIIFDSPKSRYITNIMKNGVMSWHPKNKIYVNRRYISEHKNSIFHKMSTQWFTLYDAKLRGQDLENSFYYQPGAFYSYIQSTKNFMVAVKQSVRLGLPFNKFKLLSELLNYFKVNIGYLFQNFRGMKIAVEIISEKMHNEFCSDLKIYDGPLTILLDGTTDIQTIPVVAVLFQTNFETEGVKIRLYKILKLDHGESGLNIFTALKTAIEADGIDAYVKRNLHAITSDGAPNVFSVFNSYMNSYVNQNVMRVWCSNHGIDLIYKKTVKSSRVLQQVSKAVNRCFRLFNKSPKRKQILQKVCEDNGIEPFTVKRTHLIRWVNSNIRAFEIALEKWKYILLALKQISLDKAILRKVRDEATEIIKLYIDPLFLTSLAFLVEIGNVFSFMSLQFETRGKTLISKRTVRTEFKDKLDSFKNNLLDSVDKLIKKSLVVDCATGSKTPAAGLEEFETKLIEFDGIVLSTVAAQFQKDGLHKKQNDYVKDMLALVDFYFPVNIQDSYEILNPLNFPITPGRLTNYGNADILRLNTELMWGFNDNDLTTAWNGLVRGIVADPSFTNMKNKKPEDFWQYYLSSSAPVGFEDITRTVVAKALTVSASNAESERVFSLYNSVKTYQRYLLLPKTVEAILRLRLNSNQIFSDKEAHDYAREFLVKGHTRSDAMSRRSHLADEPMWDDLVTFDDSDNDEDDNSE